MTEPVSFGLRAAYRSAAQFDPGDSIWLLTPPDWSFLSHPSGPDEPETLFAIANYPIGRGGECAPAAAPEELGLGDDEVAFYDALGANDSAVAVLGDETLRTIACDLAETVKRNATIDWAQKESVRAEMRVAVKADPSQARLSAGQTGASDGSSHRASGTAWSRFAGVSSCRSAM